MDQTQAGNGFKATARQGSDSESREGDHRALNRGSTAAPSTRPSLRGRGAWVGSRESAPHSRHGALAGLVLLAVTCGTACAEPVAAAPQVLFAETFDDGRAPGWKYYDSSLDGRDATIDDVVVHGGKGKALLGEGNAATQTLLKFLLQTSVSIPVEDDVYLDFAYHCEASGSANDEIYVFYEGHDKAGEPNGCKIPIALNPEPNRWHRVSVPIGGCEDDAAGGRMDGRLYFTWDRGAHDAHSLRIDDVRVTRGTEISPTLIHPGTFQVASDGVTVRENRYVQRLRVTARLYRIGPWKVELTIPGSKAALRTFNGSGNRVDVRWDGLDGQGHPVGAEQVVVRMTIDTGSTDHEPIVRSRTVGLGRGAFYYALDRPYALLKAKQVIQFDERTALDRIIAPADRTDAFEPLGQRRIDLRVAQGSRSGVHLKLIYLDGADDNEGVALSAGDLAAEGGQLLSAPNVQWRTLVPDPLDFGFAWQAHQAVTGAIRAPALIELSVRAPEYLEPGVYHGSVHVGSRPIELNVTVEPRTAPRLWWQDEKVRLMLAKPQVMPRPEMFYESTEGYRQIAQAGFNVMIPYIGLDDHELIAGKAQQFGLKSIARTRVPAYEREDFHEPFFVWPTGFKTPLMCPFSEAFWEEVVNPQALDLARVSTKVDLVGMEFDFEIYGQRGPNKYSHIYCHCYCDTCWQAVRDHESDIPQVEAKRRHGWLHDQRRLGAYKVFQDGRLRARARGLREAVDRINPNVQFMLLVWGAGDFLQILADEFGTALAPVLLSTESTYGRGRTPRDTPTALANHRGGCINALREAKRIGLRHGLVVPGVMPGHQNADPEFCRANAETLSRSSDGYWVFFQQVQKPSTVEQNLEQFRRANAQIVSEQ